MRASRVELRCDGTVWAENASCDNQVNIIIHSVLDNFAKTAV
jgi:hypothetical protein